MMRHLLAAALLAFFSSALAAQTFPGQEPVSESELDVNRGGFILPGGVNIALGVTIDTKIDGQLIFRSIYNLDDGPARLRILAGGDPNAGKSGELAPVLDGAGVKTAGGVIHLRSLPDGSRVEFKKDGTDVSQIFGTAFGTVLANTANNRSVDLLTTVDISVGGVTPDMVGSAMFRVEGLALESTMRLNN